MHGWGIAYCVYNLEGENGLMLPYRVTPPVVVVIYLYKVNHLARGQFEEMVSGECPIGQSAKCDSSSPHFCGTSLCGSLFGTNDSSLLPE